MKHLVLLCSVILGYLLGIYFYRLGFLLTRSSILNNSTCAEVQAESTDACWIKPRFQRAILVVIDALRYDFLVWQTPEYISEDDSARFYHNMVPIVNEVLQEQSQNALLFKFIADPPTTTLQRLKGLTTGSLPTFIDAGSNFAGSAVEEDNILDQISKRPNGRIIFMGDDTWTSLFPGRFFKEYAFPSFDTTDLHTLDNGILQHLSTEMQNTSAWRLLIAHFLGVDHCGHKYGPAHPEMSSKLKQMNSVIKSLVDSIDNDTILLVFGDHGMTQSGDHGGDSPNELGAGLFIYSKLQLHSEPVNIRPPISQIDMVPTISMLLDFPTPFSNLGSIVSELFPDLDGKLQAARANVFQVVRYVEHYLATFQDEALQQRFQPILQTFYGLEPHELTWKKCLQFVRHISQIFVETWAKFNVGWMCLGLLTLVETFLWSLSLLIDHPNYRIDGRRFFLKILQFFMSSTALYVRNESLPFTIGTVILIEVIWHIWTCAWWFFHTVSNHNINSYTLTKVIPCLILLLRGLGQFSNSFIIYEDACSRFCSATLFLFLYFPSFVIQDSSKPKEYKISKLPTTVTMKQKRKTSWFRLLNRRLNFKALLYLLIALILVRSGIWFNKCREEQVGCHGSIFTVPFASLLNVNDKITRVVVACLAMLIFICIPRQILTRNGHFAGDTAFSLLTLSGSSLLIPLLITWYGNDLSAYSVNVALAAPWIIYGSFILLTAVFLYNPVLCYQKVEKFGLQFKNKIKAYDYLRSNWREFLLKDYSKDNRSSPTTIYVYGLASSFTGPLLANLYSVYWLLLVVLGDGLSISLSCLFLCTVLALELNTLNSMDDSSVIKLMPIISLFSELSTHFFYSLAHQTTFPSIPWDAAFVGLQGSNVLVISEFEKFYMFDIGMVMQGLLVLLHLSASNLAIIASIPLIPVWNSYRDKLGHFSVQKNTDDPNSLAINSEVDCMSNDKFLNDLFTCNLLFTTCHGFKVICTVAASALHRRHLMVWKIFAPKFVFDGLLFIVICMVMILQYLFSMRLFNCLNAFLGSLKSKIE